MLRKHGVQPVLVFDGGHLPAKLRVERERSAYFITRREYKIIFCRKRKKYLEKGLEFHDKGKKTEAFECFSKCVDVSPEMAHQLILV